MERAVQTSSPGTVSEDEGGSQVHGGLTIRTLVPQETFRPARRQNEPQGPQIIVFPGEKGVRLSDALEGDWVDFEGRGGRPSFGDNRLNILIRLHVRPLPSSALHPVAHFFLQVFGVFAMAIKGKDYRTSPRSDLTLTPGLRNGLHCKAPADNKGEAGTRGGKGCEEVPRGALTTYQVYLLCI